MSGTTTTDHKLANLLGAFSVVVQDALREAEVSDSRAAAIICVGSHPGESIEELSRALGLSHSGTVRLVDRLKREHLVVRARTEKDRRTSRLRLSTQGAEEFEQLLDRRRQAIGRLIDHLPAGMAAGLTQALEALLSANTSNLADARRTCRLCAEQDCRPTGCPVETAANHVP